MTKQDFLKRLEEDLEIFSVSLTPETSVNEIDEWDSLAAMTTLAIIDEHFDLEFSVSELNNISTMNDILELIGEGKFKEKVSKT